MTTTAIRRGATAGLLGGVGWALFPWGTPFAEAEEGGTPALGQAGAGIYFALLLVVPAALLLVGLTGLHAQHRGRYGRFGAVGAALTGVGLGGMVAGLGWETVTIGFTGAESAIGHAIWMIGFLLLLPGSIVLGLAVRRARVLPRAGLAGVALMLVIPVAVAVAVVGGMVSPDGNTGFWLGLTLPYGLVWVLLGSAMRATRVEAPARRATAAV